MAITYKTSVERLECYPAHADQTNVVFSVFWSIRGVDENDIGSSRSAKTPVTYEDGSPFTPFSELTEAQVLSWIEPLISANQLAEMHAGIEGDIAWQISQSSSNEPISPPNPWPRGSMDTP